MRKGWRDLSILFSLYASIRLHHFLPLAIRIVVNE